MHASPCHTYALWTLPCRRAIPLYDELPRTSWIFKHSAQNTVVVSRTFFTQEINEAFDELEEGNEDALKTEYDRQARRACA